MKERPILFSGPMVRAILDGTKTQTRRVLKQKAVTAAGIRGILGGTGPAFGPCPYGEPGDRLWVRETWGLAWFDRDGDVNDWAAPIPHSRPGGVGVPFAADEGASHFDDRGFRWRPSIHMPRWASRIALEITDVRVERLQSISTTEAMAEGAEPRPVAGGHLSYTHGFRVLWDNINGARDGASWDSNPWVWAITFKRIQEPKP